ncbi:S1 RNA-binding domain-containing protein [Streptomyces boluensis]|uniref:S1 RNA-binding domain-containing protein n=1 Tax=Streptomyces boluensis TaxID=1775135 RepID=A0A964XML5_9ACTN|nr:S1 RNA-binding domain-containing protein [Streptomyces boluensis]NBE53286.1 S1 RNA-binding domain-containing protein [Streptomyces boluensis]
MKIGSNEPARTALEMLEIGQVCTGTVTAVADFGAFVDVDGAPGVITAPNLSWDYFEHPSQVVREGQKVTVQVLDVDLNRRQASVSVKDLYPDPFLDFARTQLGECITGTVSKAAPMGVFVRFPQNVLGLIPVAMVKESGRAFEVGESVEVEVVLINAAQRRVILSLTSKN